MKRGPQRPHGLVRVMYAIFAREVEDRDDIVERGAQPLAWVDSETRAQWHADGAITEVTRGRGKWWRLMLNLPPRQQASECMGPSIVEGYAAGMPYAEACLAAWTPRDLATRSVGVSA